MEKTYYVYDDMKLVSNVWGYCHNWKSHIKVAEKLGYKYSNDYGFKVDPVRKEFQADDVLLANVLAGNLRAATPNDYRDAQEIVKAWKYFKRLGYTNDSHVLAEAVSYTF